jgi:hypothetical protein
MFKKQYQSDCFSGVFMRKNNIEPDSKTLNENIIHKAKIATKTIKTPISWLWDIPLRPCIFELLGGGFFGFFLIVCHLQNALIHLHGQINPIGLMDKST